MVWAPVVVEVRERVVGVDLVIVDMEMIVVVMVECQVVAGLQGRDHLCKTIKYTTFYGPIW